MSFIDDFRVKYVIPDLACPGLNPGIRDPVPSLGYLVCESLRSDSENDIKLLS